MHAENRTMTAAGYELNTTTTGACEAMALTRVLHTFLTADDHHEKLLRTAAATAGAAVGTSALWLLARAMRRALTRRFGVPVRRVFEMARVPDAGRGAHRHRNRQHPARLATLSERIDGLMKPFLPARELLESIQGFSQIIADIFIATTGGDMTQFLEHAMLTAAWNMLSNGEFYRDPGPDYATRHDPARTRARAVKLLEALGYDVTLQQVTQAG